MRQAQPGARAVVLSRFDLPDAADLMVSSCEDCACPVSGYQSALPRSAAPGADNTRWVHAAGTVESRLDDDHRLLFNPLGSYGVAVVNQPAYDVYAGVSRGADGTEAQDVLRALASLELIHPDGQPSRPVMAPSQVLTAWLHVTNGCNLRCPYCYVHKSAEAMDEPTGRAVVDSLIASALAHGFRTVKLKYAGGEASLNHHLVVKLHEYATELAAASGLRLEATLLSNGVRLPEHLVRTCKEAGIRVMISLDGVGQRHDVQRPFASGKPSFHLVERTIAALIDQECAPHLSVTVTGRNADGLPDVVRFALERDLTFSINLFRDNDCAATVPDLRYEEEEIIGSLRAAFEVIERSLPRWSVLGSVLDRGQLLQPRQRSCGVGQDYLVIDQRGRVAKCHMEIERTLGDVFSGDPLTLVRQDRASALNLLVEEKEGCRDCTWRYWCSGGCSVATFRATGRYDIKSPNCNIYKAIYPDALRLEGLRLLRYARA
jgi:uncharacterized protein